METIDASTLSRFLQLVVGCLVCHYLNYNNGKF
jgi:hypothetical protein